MKDDKPELELLECQLELAGQEPLPLVKDNKPCNPTVEILQLPEPTLDRKTQRFSFIYSPGDDQQAPPTASLLCRIALQYSVSVGCGSSPLPGEAVCCSWPNGATTRCLAPHLSD